MENRRRAHCVPMAAGIGWRAFRWHSHHPMHAKNSEDQSMFEISRRDLIVGAAGAYAAFGLDRPLALIGAAQAQTTPATPGFKSTKVGDLEVISLYDGVWEKAHDENFIKGANV